MMTTALLNLLLHERTPHTIESLALALQLPRDMVVAQLDALRQLGCTFDEHPQHGVQLTASGLATWADAIEHLSPRRVEVYRSTASTQDIARRWADHRAVVLADEQTAGRGRLGRRWHAPPGSALLFSYVSTLAAANHDQITSAAAVAIAEAIEGLAPNSLRLSIKWPNDVLADGRKLAGILVERTATAAVIGIGINIAATPDAVSDAACLREIGIDADRLLVLLKVLGRLDRRIADAATGGHVAAWRARCLAITRPVHLQSDGRIVEGEVLDVDPSHGLIVRTTTGALVHLPAATTGRV